MIFFILFPREKILTRDEGSRCSSWKRTFSSVLLDFERSGNLKKADLEFQSRNSIESRTCAIKECRWHPFETKINLFNYVVIEETCNYKQSAQSLVATTYGRLARIFESRITKRCVQIIFQYKDFSVIKRGEEKYIARKMRSSRASRQTERERERFSFAETFFSIPG